MSRRKSIRLAEKILENEESLNFRIKEPLRDPLLQSVLRSQERIGNAPRSQQRAKLGYNARCVWLPSLDSFSMLSHPWDAQTLTPQRDSSIRPISPQAICKDHFLPENINLCPALQWVACPNSCCVSSLVSPHPLMSSHSLGPSGQEEACPVESNPMVAKSPPASLL